MRFITAFLAISLLFPLPGQAATPQKPDALPQLFQAAIDAKDSSKAMPHLKVEQIVTSVFEETLPQINESVKNGELVLSPPLAAALAAFNSGNMVTKRTATIFLTTELSKFMIYGVDSGAFAGDPIPENERMLMDGGVFSKFGDISLERKEFSHTRLLKDNGKTALIQTRLYDHGVKRAYVLKVRLILEDGIWKASAIENAAELYTKIAQER